jgi:hypothetical protein
MRLHRVFSSLWPISTTTAYYSLLSYAPRHPEVHEKVINAANKVFVIGAENPTTYCGLDDPRSCPSSNSTLVDAEMTRLAVCGYPLTILIDLGCRRDVIGRILTRRDTQSAVPGGQFIYVAPNGLISYPSAHSSLRPPGSEMGGFFSFQLLSDCVIPITVLSWQSTDGYAGLWACPVGPRRHISEMAVLKASSDKFAGKGCIELEGILIQEAGDEFGAWAYT